MTVNNIKIEDLCVEDLLRYCKIYSFLAPFYFLFAAFFGIVGVWLLVDLPMEEMWMVPLMGIVGCIIFVIVGVNLVKKVIAMKAELNTRDVTQEDRDAATRSATQLLIACIAIIVIFVGILLAVLLPGMDSGSSSSSVSGEPWKDLGISESEYMDIYNRIKYGN